MAVCFTCPLLQTKRRLSGWRTGKILGKTIIVKKLLMETSFYTRPEGIR
jgi:hypothetical protein